MTKFIDHLILLKTDERVFNHWSKLRKIYLLKLKNKFPKKPQEILLKYLTHVNVVIWSRQVGKSHTAYQLSQDFLTDKSQEETFAGIFMPTEDQAKAIYWRHFSRNLKSFNARKNKADGIIRYFRDVNRASEVHFNGIAMQQSKHKRGGTYDIIFADEFDSWEDGVYDSVIAAQGDVKNAPQILTGTVGGYGPLFRKLKQAKKAMREGDKDFFGMVWTMYDSLIWGEVSIKWCERLLKRYSHPKELNKLLAEYFCVFGAYEIGKIFANEVNHAEESGQIGKYPFIPEYHVDTFWDIGIHGTAVWFRQVIDNKKRYFLFIEDNADVHFQTFVKEKYMKVVDQYGMNIRYNIFPWDMVKKEYMSLKPRIEVAQDLMPGISKCFPVFKDPNEGIDYAKRTWDQCYFDVLGTEVGFERLRNFKRKLNGKPDKNEDSHGADAFIIAENFKSFDQLYDHLSKEDDLKDFDKDDLLKMHAKTLSLRYRKDRNIGFDRSFNIGNNLDGDDILEY